MSKRKDQLLLCFKEEKRKTCVTRLVQPSWITFQEVPLGIHLLLRIKFVLYELKWITIGLQSCMNTIEKSRYLSVWVGFL